MVFASIFNVTAAKEADLYQERTAAVQAPQRIGPCRFLTSDFLPLVSSFLAFAVSKPAVYMVPIFLEGRISYLSLGTRGQLVKVPVEREMRLPKLVMHQTVMAGNCLKKIHFVMN